jgi:hypothetical protein
MRIYLESIKPENITIKKLRSLDMYFRKKQDYTEFLSETGIYHIENDKFFRIVPKDGPLQKIVNSGLSLLIDESSFLKIPVLSQIPIEHSTISLTRMLFSQHEKSDLLLCVEGMYNKKQGGDKYEDFVILDFYFIPPYPPYPPLEKVEPNQKQLEPNQKQLEPNQRQLGNQRKLGKLDPNQKRLGDSIVPKSNKVDLNKNLYTDDGRFWLQFFYSRFL